MYESHWGLTKPPFQNVPDPNFFFLSDQHREGLARLLYTVRHNKGAALLIGDVGCGKTTLSRALIVQLAEEKFDIGLITNPSLPRNDFLEEIDLQLGIIPASTSKVALLRALNERLLRNLDDGKDTVLIVDEAHAIHDPEVFEELRMLLNFQLNERFLMTLILMAQPEIKDTISRIRQLDQRIAIRYVLRPLDRRETARYIAFRLERAGATRPFFTEEALTIVWEKSQGVPRSINTLCDLCLLDGCTTGAQTVDVAMVKRVVAAAV
ncbi:MAG: AAA family ATPase [candidate division NC10 bacterium]|nr:AAA family ATPase [candidate division NC10 bacterium]